MLIVTVIAVLVAAYLAYLAGSRVTAEKMAKHLNKVIPDGPPTQAQGFAGLNCYWVCVTNYWFGIPIGTTCTYYCDQGGGPQ